MLKAIIYIRFSTLEQREGASIDRQMERTHILCEGHGWDVETILRDEGKSAFTGAHRLEGAAFATFEREALSGLHAGKVLVIERLSRLSRLEYNETYDLMRSLTKAGVTVAVWDGDRIYKANEPIDFVSVIELLVKAKTNFDESQTKRDFGKDKWERRRRDARAGRIVTKNGPPWLELSPDRSKWIEIKDRVALVRRIFKMADDGDGHHTIAKKLNLERVAPWARYANRVPSAWDRKFIQRIVTNIAVIGDYQMMSESSDGGKHPEGDPVRGYFPRVIEPDIFERVNRELPDRKAFGGGKRSTVVANLVAGLARCNECGGAMVYERCRAKGSTVIRNGRETAPQPHETAYLYCRSNHRGAGCANKAGVAYLGLERALLDHALHLALDDSHFTRNDDVGRLNILIADRKRDADALTNKAKSLWNAYTEFESAMAMKMAIEAESDAKAIMAEITTLNGDRDKALGQASAAEHLSRLNEVRAHLYDDDIEVRRTHRLKVAAGLRSVIDRIECLTDRRAGVVFKYELRLIIIEPGIGRRPAKVIDHDLHHVNRGYMSLTDEQNQEIARYLARRPEMAAA